MNIETHYGQLLGLSNEWKVDKVDLSLPKQRVEIAVSWNGGDVLECPQCGGKCSIYDLREERSWRHLETMQFETIIRARTPRCQCREHGVLTISTPWSGKHSRFTLMFEAFAICVLECSQSVEAARKLFRLSWNQVDEIRKRAVERGLQRREAEPVERLGIDEKSFGRHHDYISIMTDLDGGRVLEVVPERKQEAAQRLINTLSHEQREEVLAVAIDMWPAYMNAVETLLPEAVMVHDKFHVVKHLGEAVDKVRKQENAQLRKQGNNSLVGEKYTFLKRVENMIDAQRARFESLMKSSLKTARACSIKELFEEFWSYEFVKDARGFFRHWYNRAIRSRLEPIKQKTRMLKKHLKGLLNYTIHPITNAATEGLNSKIQTIKSNARGFRSFESYRVAILFYCGKLDMNPAQK